LVERQTRYVMLAKIAARDTRSVIDALIKQSNHLPEEQRSSTNH
jgi:IS30 family transposase